MNTDNLSSSVIKCAYAVHNTLGIGFLEKVYENALFEELRFAGIASQAQQKLEVTYRNKPIGEFYCDLLVEQVLIVELKATKTIAPEHLAQTINYLKAGTVKEGLLINFGSPKLEIRRLHG